MKQIYMILAAVLLTSCVRDLDTLPPQGALPVSENVYGKTEDTYLEGLSFLYFQFVTNDLTDLQQMDGGASELIRAFWSVQETTADAVKCAWENDAWVRALNTDTWNSEQNDAVYAVYVRTLQGIAYVNEYLRQTTDEKLDARSVPDDVKHKVYGFRDEARFLRAYFYWMALDCFGSVPFSTEDSPFGGTYTPPQASRKDIFDFCISELKGLLSEGSNLPAARSAYPRADKGSAAGLLARLYLNAEVYTGTAMWSQAKDVCEEIFDMGYALSPDYEALFRGDNGDNPAARNEMLWAVSYNAEKTQSYGGTSYLLAASLAATDITDQSKPNGQRNGWAGLRTPYEYVDRFFKVSGQDYAMGDYQTADARGKMFYIKGRQESMVNALYVFTNGWSCLKFNNIPHDMTESAYLPTADTKAFSDVDFPMIRLAEIYLIYAEACMNTGDDALGLLRLAELSARAGVQPPAEITEEFLMEERARELMWEAHRRTDLIRYGLFTSGDYLWPYKGGDSFAGQAFPSYKVLFPLPPTELAVNANLKQNPGY